MKHYLKLYFLILLFYSILPGYCHKPSDSYITLHREQEKILGEWHIFLKDLDFAIGLDDDKNNLITWKELKNHHNDIENYCLPKFKMTVNGKECENVIIKHLVDKHSDGAYEVMKFEIVTPQENKIPKIFDLHYELFFDIDEEHRGLLNINHKGKVITSIFSTDKPLDHFDLDSNTLFKQFLEFLKEGIWHIWIGLDHILFLISLLLPSVLILRNKNWEAVSSFKEAFLDVFKIVTSFTIAHSITLSIAALEIIKLPSKFVESAIALSVILAALNNIFPVFKNKRWMIAFLFGLIHGFGFASVLMDLGLLKETLVAALLSFNVGVELGQLVIVSLFLPIAYSIRKVLPYRKCILFPGSIFIIIIAFIWLVERAFDLSILPPIG